MCDPQGDQNGASWEIMWCYCGWYDVADRPLSQQVANCDVLIPTTGTVDASVIRAASKCKLITNSAAGYNNIDVAVAKELGIPVTIAPGTNSQSVAEAAVMLMLMLARKVREGEAVFKARRIGEPIGMELAGKVLGIIGLGNVGSALERAAHGLGMQVMGVNSRSSREDLEALLRQAHVVSLHCPLTDRTTGLIGAHELELMRPNAILINCARGPVIDRGALEFALKEGKLAGVGLDVHWVEPADPDEELYKHPKVIALPHTGTITHEVYERFATVLCENIVRAHDGRPLLNQLT